MQCQHCHNELEADASVCSRCGAEQPRRRFLFTPAREEFVLKSEEPFEWGDPERREEWQLPPDVASQFSARNAPAAIVMPPEIRWGGFFRRGTALVIDCFVIIVLALAMGLMAYVGYKVGLAAHHRSVTGPTLAPLVALLTIATMLLATAYFVLFHGMEGKTVGKWLLRLRVVGPGNHPITYRRALMRWFGTLVFAPLLLGFLWALFSREKRAWHDYLAHTWVIID